MECTQCGSKWDSSIEVSECPFCGNDMRKIEIEVNNITDALQRIIYERSIDVFETPKIVMSLVNDYISGFERERRLLKAACSNGALDYVLAAAKEEDVQKKDVHFRKLKQHLIDYAFLSEENAEQVIDIFKGGLEEPRLPAVPCGSPKYNVDELVNCGMLMHELRQKKTGYIRGVITNPVKGEVLINYNGYTKGFAAPLDIMGCGLGYGDVIEAVMEDMDDDTAVLDIRRVVNYHKVVGAVVKGIILNAETGLVLVNSYNCVAGYLPAEELRNAGLKDNDSIEAVVVGIDVNRNFCRKNTLKLKLTLLLPGLDASEKYNIWGSPDDDFLDISAVVTDAEKGEVILNHRGYTRGHISAEEIAVRNFGFGDFISGDIDPEDGAETAEMSELHDNSRFTSFILYGNAIEMNNNGGYIWGALGFDESMVSLHDEFIIGNIANGVITDAEIGRLLLMNRNGYIFYGHLPVSIINRNELREGDNFGVKIIGINADGTAELELSPFFKKPVRCDDIIYHSGKLKSAATGEVTMDCGDWGYILDDEMHLLDKYNIREGDKVVVKVISDTGEPWGLSLLGKVRFLLHSTDQLLGVSCYGRLLDYETGKVDVNGRTGYFCSSSDIDRIEKRNDEYGIGWIIKVKVAGIRADGNYSLRFEKYADEVDFSDFDTDFGDDEASFFYYPYKCHVGRLINAETGEVKLNTAFSSQETGFIHPADLYLLESNGVAEGDFVAVRITGPYNENEANMSLVDEWGDYLEYTVPDYFTGAYNGELVNADTGEVRLYDSDRKSYIIDTLDILDRNMVSGSIVCVMIAALRDDGNYELVLDTDMGSIVDEDDDDICWEEYEPADDIDDFDDFEDDDFEDDDFEDDDFEDDDFEDDDFDDFE